VDTQHLQKPVLILAAKLWTALGVPLLFHTLAGPVGLRSADPGLFVGLQGIASPMMAAPALAALMGLDATLILVNLVTATALLPIVAQTPAQFSLEGNLAISPVALGSRLGIPLAGSLLLATHPPPTCRRRHD
jgi:hypothetical protein